MNQMKRMQKRLVSFLALGLMIAGLMTYSYQIFLKTIEVDVMQSAHLIYEGDNGNGSLSIAIPYKGLNQRTANFLSTVRFKVSPNTGLSNGDVVLVEADYDHELAVKYNYQPVNTKLNLVVSGLPNRFVNADSIPKSMIRNIRRMMEEKLDETANEISPKAGRLKDLKVVYMAFMQDKSGQATDRIVMIWQLSYQHGDVLYAMHMPRINESKHLAEDELFGDKAYIGQDETAEAYLNRVYGSSYQISTLEL